MHQTFIENRDDPPLAPNLPKVTGAIMWCRGILERVKAPMEKLKSLNRNVLNTEDAKDVVKTYTSLVASLSEYEYVVIIAQLFLSMASLLLTANLLQTYQNRGLDQRY